MKKNIWSWMGWGALVLIVISGLIWAYSSFPLFVSSIHFSYSTTQSKTVDYYDIHANQFASDTAHMDFTGRYKPFLKYVKKGGHILDAGCGCGRDVEYFQKQGYEVTAFDASIEMVRIATKITGREISCRTFGDVNEIQQYDGIWANNSLLHLPKKRLFYSIDKLCRALKPGGVLFMSFKKGDFEGFEEGRYYTYMDEETLEEMLKPLEDIERVEAWTEVEEGHPWLQMIIRKT